MADSIREIGPQPGPQTAFLSSPADIVIYGGAAGGGKSFGLLLDPLRYVNVPGFGFVIFRRESPQITNEGGLWDKSLELYPFVGATPRRYDLSWQFSTSVKGRFSHLQRDDDVLKWQGSEIAYLGFDELTHFTSEQFFYMLSRNRSVCGVKPCVRATTNPAPGWVKDFLSPWLEPGHPQSALSGEIRWFIRKDGRIVWVDDSYRDAEDSPAKSVTFVRSTIYDNQILLKKDPGYLTNLKSLEAIDQARLLHGDWEALNGAFYSAFRTDGEQSHHVTARFTPDNPPPKWYTFFGGMDWGFADPWAFCLCCMDETGTIHVLQSDQQAALSDDEQADRIVLMLTHWGVPLDRCTIMAGEDCWAKKTHNGIQVEPIVNAFYKRGLDMAATSNSYEGQRHRAGIVRRYLSAFGKIRFNRGFNDDLVTAMQNAQHATAPAHNEIPKHDKYSHAVFALACAVACWPEPSTELGHNSDWSGQTRNLSTGALADSRVVTVGSARTITSPSALPQGSLDKYDNPAGF